MTRFELFAQGEPSRYPTLARTFAVEAPKPYNKALLPLTNALALGPIATLQAAIAQAAAQNGANWNALRTACYRNAPREPQRGKRLLAGQEEAAVP